MTLTPGRGGRRRQTWRRRRRGRRSCCCGSWLPDWTTTDSWRETKWRQNKRKKISFFKSQFFIITLSKLFHNCWHLVQMVPFISDFFNTNNFLSSIESSLSGLWQKRRYISQKNDPRPRFEWKSGPICFWNALLLWINLMNESREALLKGKGQYGWSPCTI